MNIGTRDKDFINPLAEIVPSKFTSLGNHLRDRTRAPPRSPNLNPDSSLDAFCEPR